MMTFDQVLPELLRVCAAPAYGAFTKIAVVRDVRGRVRLVVDPGEAETQALEQLEKTLEHALGGFFAPPILSTNGPWEHGRLGKKLIETADGQWPTGWPNVSKDYLGIETEIDAGGRWTGIDRTITKDAWLATRPPAPPWPSAHGPSILTFHSYKGGVGRSTLLAVYAIHSALADKKVAVVDLDLEAPGLGAYFAANTKRGTLDVLVDHIATNSLSIEEASATVPVTGGHEITVFPAGRVDSTYLQKLARLDFSSIEPGGENPVSAALVALLKKLKHQFDLILLDARAGLHDLAGIALHGLAHVDVLVFRGTSQNLVGLEETLAVLGRRDTQRLVLVETLLPSDRELREHREHTTREKVYAMMLEHVYPADPDPPQLGDLDEPHDVVSLPRLEWLDGLDSLVDDIARIGQEPVFSVLIRRINECLEQSETDEAETGAPE